MAGPTDGGAWIRRFHPAPQASTRLICLPHAGGSASYYFPVSRALSPLLDVLAIQYPGRQDRRGEPCVDDLRTLADLLVPLLLPWTDRPFVLFGHSMGATLAFEVAVRLAQRGITPHGLFASGRRAPSCFRDERVHLYSDAEFIADLKGLSGTDPQMFDDEQVVSMILPALRSDYRAAETYRYRPTPPLACPVVALTGDTDPQVTIDEAGTWAEHTTGPFALGVYPGGHFFLNEHAPAVLDVIRDHVARRPLSLPRSATAG
ncbi:alpha/beta fold hydrolase [Micromonospora sp. NBC_01699]|uniref:thioesterase II family protein n=1 Tax=Micromonospora sp. NBC_01699 TaxID=2975984 RepID=UPI002E2E54E6|nr:alpha/beta fold hydrolase [Micromonospora sp. NBC_01699]